MERSAHNVESAGSSPPCKDLELKVTNNIVLRPCLLGRLQYRSVCNSERRHDQLQSVNVSSTHAVVWQSRNQLQYVATTFRNNQQIHQSAYLNVHVYRPTPYV